MLHNIDYFGFFYKWTNNRNKKYYIGSHHGPTDYGYIGSGGYVDIEHCLYKFLDHNKVIEKDGLGICGNIATNGAAIND